jgi:hypothetical protein
MAGEWIKVRTNLWSDPRVSQLCDLTGQGKAAVIGALYWLWASADEHTEDGHMPGLSLKGIDRETGIPGMGAALVEIEWVTDNIRGVTLTRFDEHNGASAKQRAQTAKRVSSYKERVKVTPESQNGNAHNVNSALPREEKSKRREEVNQNLKVKPTVDGESPPDRRAPPKRDDALEVFEHWQTVMAKPSAKLDAKRVKAIKARLADGYTVGDLCKAIDGNKADAWSQGANDRRTPYNDIELICRDGPKVDKFMALAARAPPQQQRPANTQATYDALQRAMDRE